MLNKIPKILSSDIVKFLMEMGHGDEVLICDANYPANTNNNTVIHADGIDSTTLLRAILELMPLDNYSEYQGILMEVVPGDPSEPEVWTEYKSEIDTVFPGAEIKLIERQEFYEYSRNCLGIIQSGEERLYGNLIIKKGVVK
ncbi:fucose isomerase [Companilactobacillus sp. RD055328]|uniref:RbsD/FucU family protein n=1 Tax=Companilactobacillus sp. RD055328 TaxID=2916634 RepID=UPI001FC7C18F|nr:RbsD/FucU domain-containing protein [Companilactobacillus sp. RD055328]GKQ43457.1 fucose isomerase [Companilactobacillus sp. RD055328]